MPKHEQPEATTKVSGSNSTAVPKPFRNNRNIDRGDRLGWFKQDGRWYIELVESEDEEGN